MSAQEWFAGSNTPAKKLDLKPDDMDTRKHIHFSFSNDV